MRQYNPDGLSVYDNDRLLPLHRECVESGNIVVVESLIKKLDGAVLPPTKNGVPTLLLACEKGVSHDVIFTLVHQKRELFPGDDRSTLALSALTAGNDDDDDDDGNLGSSRKRQKTK